MLGFERVYDYVAGKVDWFAYGLPRQGQTEQVPYASELVDTDPPHCALSDDLTTVRLEVEASPYGFCLVLSNEGIVLGRVRRSALSEAASDATAEDIMELGPSTVRASTPASELVERLAKRDLKTAIVTTPTGRLIGVFDRARVEKRLASAESDDRP